VRPMVHKWALTALALLWAAAGAAQAEGPLSAQLTPVTPRPRSGSPIPVEIELTSADAGVLDGRLEMSLYDGREPLWHYAYAPIALAQGRQRFAVLLPAAQTMTGGSMNALRVRFVTEGGAYDLGEHRIPLASAAERSFVICVNSSAGAGGYLPATVIDRLALRRFSPGPEAGQRYDFSTTSAVVSPRDFPTDPLGYCAYDIVFLGAEGLGELGRRQLAALSAWVRAGGALCIADARGVEPQHVEALNDLVGVAGPAFGLPGGSDGLSVPGVPVPGALLRRCGLGRLAVLTSTATSDSGVWARTSAFLWRLRRNQSEAALSSGTWLAEAARSARPEPSYPGYWSRSGEIGFRPIPVAGVEQLARALMSEEVAVIPLGMVILAFLLLLLVIGPVDYFVLGLFRARRLTWIFFPAACIGFTLVLVFLSNRYVGRTDHRRSLTVVDLGPGPAVLRQSRFELVFAAKEKDAETDVRNALCADMGTADVRSYYGWSGYDRTSSGPPTLVGRVPTRFVLRRRLRQWTPLLSREMSFVGGDELPALDWDAVSPADFEGHQAYMRVPVKLRGTAGFDGAIYILNGDRMAQVSGRADLLRVERGSAYYESAFTLQDFLRTVSMGPGYGLLDVVSQISPSGGPNFEDLCLLDGSDPDEWMVIVAERRGEDYCLYRRLYRGTTE
jgi:hypothetical protein